MKQKQISKQRHQLAIAALGLLVGTTLSTSDLRKTVNTRRCCG